MQQYYQSLKIKLTFNKLTFKNKRSNNLFRVTFCRQNLIFDVTSHFKNSIPLSFSKWKIINFTKKKFVLCFSTEVLLTVTSTGAEKLILFKTLI